MTKAQVGSSSSGSAASGLAVVGVVLVAAFFAPWIDVAGELELSGWWLANHDNTRLFLVPALGAALIAAGATRSKYLPLIAGIASLAIVGTTAYHTVRSVLHFEYGALLTLVGGGIALAGISDQRRGLRALGGAIALAGFFLPWATEASGWNLVRADDPVLDALGISFCSLWAIPAGALIALASALMAKPNGRAAAGIGGALVLGGFLWFLGTLVNVVAGWGVWTTLGAGIAAGLLALIAAARR